MWALNKRSWVHNLMHNPQKPWLSFWNGSLKSEPLGFDPKSHPDQMVETSFECSSETQARICCSWPSHLHNNVEWELWGLGSVSSHQNKTSYNAANKFLIEGWAPGPGPSFGLVLNILTIFLERMKSVIWTSGKGQGHSKEKQHKERELNLKKPRKNINTHDPDI